MGLSKKFEGICEHMAENFFDENVKKDNFINQSYLHKKSNRYFF